MLEKSDELKGLCYGIISEVDAQGNRGIVWKQCDLFTNEETQAIRKAAEILSVFFDNLERLDAIQEAYQEFLEELRSARSDSRFVIALIDRRFRAFVMEWRLFLDHWKKYIDDGAQIRSREQGAEKEEYIRKFKELYSKTTTEHYDNCDSYVIAHAIRNHVVHANRSIYHAHISLDGNRVYISRDALLSETNISASQREVLLRQNKEIDLVKIATESLKAAEEIMDELIRYQIDRDVIDATIALTGTFQRIATAGITAHIWMFFMPTGKSEMDYQLFEFDRYKSLAEHLIRMGIIES